MNLKELLGYFDGDEEALRVPLDADAIAVFLTSALQQLESEYPGIVGRHGWARLEDVEAFAHALLQANQATPPAGLR